MTHDTSRITQARRRAGRRLGFLIHAAVFGAVNLGLIAINIAAAPAHPWSAYPLLGWGFGLLMHGLATSGAFGRAYDTLVERELARLPAARDVQP
jgi:hypothetical protein